jgi:hypothetical protein
MANCATRVLDFFYTEFCFAARLPLQGIRVQGGALITTPIFERKTWRLEP